MIATNNKGKLLDIKKLLPRHITFYSPKDFNLIEPIENEKTFEGNAVIKAKYCAEKSKLISLSDDSGIEIATLNGDPGIFSARWAGNHGDDRANTAKVLESLIGVPDEKRGAHFTCVAALAFPDGRTHVEEARFDGWILHSPVGDQGFGYDPIFRPDGLEISSAQMSAEAKDAISHRGKSLRAIAPHVITLLNTLG